MITTGIVYSPQVLVSFRKFGAVCRGKRSTQGIEMRAHRLRLGGMKSGVIEVSCFWNMN
jgi:hypothetical protein